MAETILAQPPSDGISAIKFSHSSSLLLATSWDCTLRLYDAERNTLRGRFEGGAAVLDGCFSDDNTGFAGGLDCSLTMLVLSTNLNCLCFNVRSL
jgi:cell cycle arrest protein BUB3